MSANLGDPDAQAELAFCYANGKGCKKDMKLAAKVSPFSFFFLSPLALRTRWYQVLMFNIMWIVL